MFSLIHLSDIHIGYSDTEDRNAVALVRHIVEKFPPGTVVVASGDFVQTGMSGEYARVEAVLAPLREKFTLLTCPGNHDYSCNWLGSKLSQHSVAMFMNHVNMGTFPQTHVVEAESTVLVGLDSSDLNDKAWLAGGLVECWQVDRMKEILAEHGDKLRVVYFHHHPFVWRVYMLFFGSSALLRAMASHGVGLAMFGHRHWSQLMRNTRGIPLMLSSGKSTKPRWFSGGKLSFRVVEIEDGRVLRVYAEEFKP